MSNLMSNYSPLEVTFVKGEGCWLTDSNGDEYLDALSGIGVVNLGHCHPTVTKNLVNQSQKLLHTSNVYRIDNQEKLAKNLCDLAKMDKVFFSNSGAEANEGAIKMAFKYHNGKRKTILHSNISFHGKTLGAASITASKEVNYQFLSS